MKARIENGQIKRYINLPKYYKHWAGNFDTQPDAIHEQERFYPVIEPIIDYNLQTKGNLYFDDINKVFAYKIVDIVHDIESIRTTILDGLDNTFDMSMLEILHEHLATILLGNSLPKEVKDEVIRLQTERDILNSSINKETDPNKLNKVNYDSIQPKKSVNKIL
jgi:hypothetical protein